MAMQQAELVIKSGPHAGQRIPFLGSKCIIGRERDCHFKPEDDMISRHHCVIRFDGITYRIRDLGSRNGTFVNGNSIRSDVVLVPDDEIMAGSMVFQISLHTPGEESDTEENSLELTDIIDGTTISTHQTKSASNQDTKKSFLLPDSLPKHKTESDELLVTGRGSALEGSTNNHSGCWRPQTTFYRTLNLHKLPYLSWTRFKVALG